MNVINNKLFLFGSIQANAENIINVVMTNIRIDIKRKNLNLFMTYDLVTLELNI